MYLCDKNFCCCGWQYYDSEADIDEDAKDCSHLIEVAPVIHAHWIIRKWGANAQCSNCKRYFDDVYDMDNSDNYCRHCGAKMDLRGVMNNDRA